MVSVNSRPAERICIKFGVNIMSQKATPDSYI
jgi:hypothetical protein